MSLVSNNHLLARLAQTIFTYADDITAVSTFLSQSIQDFLVSHKAPKIIHTIENGVDAKFFTLPFPAIHQKIHLLYLGSLIPRKRVAVLIKACIAALAKQAQLHLTIFGNGPELATLKTLIERNKMSTHITLRPAIPPQNVPDVMKDFHCLALFSAAEGRPNVIIEAMAAGRAILATNLPGVVELLGNTNCGYIAPIDDVQALSQIIIQACTAPEVLEAMGARARERVRTLELNWEKTAQKYERVYQKNM